jgi:hypothetical protein
MPSASGVINVTQASEWHNPFTQGGSLKLSSPVVNKSPYQRTTHCIT